MFSPSIVLRVEKPEISIEKNAKGKLNVMTLMKDTPVSTQPAAPKSNAQMALPAIVLKSKTNIEIFKALLKYKDHSTQTSVVVQDINFKVKDISLNHPITAEMWADVNTQMGKDIKVKGPFKITSSTQVNLKDNQFDSADISVKANFDKLVVTYPEMFEKTKTMPFNQSSKIHITKQDIQILESKQVFHTLEFNSKGNIANYTTEQPKMDIQFSSNEMDLASFGEVTPYIKDYNISGKTKLKGDLTGDYKKQILNILLTISNNVMKINTKIKDSSDYDYVVSSNNLWGSQFLLTGDVKMPSAPKLPQYGFNLNIQHMDMKSAISAGVEAFKNTLYGSLDMTLKGSGSGFSPPIAKKNLNAKGQFKVSKATFATIDVSKMVITGINEAITKIADKVPQLRGQKLGNIPNQNAKYESITSDFSIQNGEFNMPNFFAKSEPNQGLDIRGNTQLGLIGYALTASWEIIDTYNLTKVKDLGVDVSGIRVNNILSENGAPVRFPIVIGGTATSPKPSYLSLPEHFGRVAMNNISRAVGERAKAEVQKRAQEQLQNIGKKLFGH
jgi:hypothetical protein